MVYLLEKEKGTENNRKSFIENPRWVERLVIELFSSFSHLDT